MRVRPPIGEDAADEPGAQADDGPVKSQTARWPATETHAGPGSLRDSRHTCSFAPLFIIDTIVENATVCLVSFFVAVQRRQSTPPVWACREPHARAPVAAG